MSLRHHVLAAAFTGALALCASGAQASVTYQFSLDTSSILATSGFLDMQFSASGGGTDPTATATISNFQIGGGAITGAPQLFGSAAGALPGPVTLDVLGDGAFNDYFQSVQFGSSLSFDLTISGQAVDAPPCTGAPGTDCSLPGFALDLMNATEDQFLLTGDPLGQTDFGWLLAQVQVNEDGSTTLTTAPGTGGGNSLVTARLAAAAPVPEPASWALMLFGVGAAGVAARRRASR